MKYTSFVFAIFFSVCGLSSVSAYGSYEKTQSAKGGQNIGNKFNLSKIAYIMT